jgi:hypothetical protein
VLGAQSTVGCIPGWRGNRDERWPPRPRARGSLGRARCANQRARPPPSTWIHRLADCFEWVVTRECPCVLGESGSSRGPFRADTKGISEVQLSHTPRSISAVFDDPNLVSAAGLVPIVGLAQQAGPGPLGDEHLSATDKGANAGLKVTSLVAGMTAGADSIDDMGVLRHGGMGRVFERASSSVRMRLRRRVPASVHLRPRPPTRRGRVSFPDRTRRPDAVGGHDPTQTDHRPRQDRPLSPTADSPPSTTLAMGDRLERPLRPDLRTTHPRSDLTTQPATAPQRKQWNTPDSKVPHPTCTNPDPSATTDSEHQSLAPRWIEA